MTLVLSTCLPPEPCGQGGSALMIGGRHRSPEAGLGVHEPLGPRGIALTSTNQMLRSYA